MTCAECHGWLTAAKDNLHYDIPICQYSKTEYLKKRLDKYLFSCSVGLDVVILFIKFRGEERF